MSYHFLPNFLYRMPTHFGPSLGARQGPNGLRFSNQASPDDTTLQASFNADIRQLCGLLPPGFSLREPSLINFSFSYIQNIEWLAGRGYNTFTVSVPATYKGNDELVHGELILVIWENMADPIITGREDIGYSKIYGDIPAMQCIGDDIICRASWDGFEFASMTFRNIRAISLDDLRAEPVEAESSEGTLHYKYFPKTGCVGEVDIAYAVLTPEDSPNLKIEQAKRAETALLQINRATWQQLPTQVHIVNALADIRLGKCSSAILLKMCGGKDLSDTRILT